MSKRHPKNYLKLFPKKKYGQHFLVSTEIVDSIIDYSQIDPNDIVVEIGPGLGALSENIIRLAKKTFLIEKDPRLSEFLSNEFKEYIETKRCEIINADACTFNFNNLKIAQKFKIVSNLPYNVAIPILFNIYEFREKVSLMTLMFQKEVAERIVANPGTKKFGVLTLQAQLYADIIKILDCTPDDFFPPPKVRSQVIQFVFLNESRIKITHKDLFDVLVKAAFFRRRKKIINSLQSSKIFDEDIIKKMFDEISVDPGKRAEALGFEDYYKMYEYLLPSFLEG